MPFKRNPVQSEKSCSLARALSIMPQTAWNNAGNSLLERTLDDSANRRSLLPESFLICDELIKTTIKTLQGLRINKDAVAKNLSTYAPFAATERVLMAMSKAGGNRQHVHERLREHALIAWQAVQIGNPNPLKELIKNDPMFKELDEKKLNDLFDVKGYTGFAPSRSMSMAEKIKQTIAK